MSINIYSYSFIPPGFLTSSFYVILIFSQVFWLMIVHSTGKHVWTVSSANQIPVVAVDWWNLKLTL